MQSNAINMLSNIYIYIYLDYVPRAVYLALSCLSLQQVTAQAAEEQECKYGSYKHSVGK